MDETDGNGFDNEQIALMVGNVMFATMFLALFSAWPQADPWIALFVFIFGFTVVVFYSWIVWDFNYRYILQSSDIISAFQF